ncbi:hypothetical protein [Streptomyces iconiensis]|uniref:Uncharacterized protein n=1 Tax=Streptomyces iconiensis TaxID=1384038 RepID=A0ABT7A6L9_9ACTN|nr:hypothetical protein [Streptomyces iconiensis]MDJ1136273.1 hypothetical protein [Streptomyces iconiensis]
MLAEAADHDGGLSSAATALNRAALIASDCGLPDLARELCWRHADTYPSAQPFSGQQARLALEPLVNLARLRIRDGDGEGAYQVLASLYEGVRAQAETDIDGRSLSLARLTSTPDDRRTVCQWLWSVLLGEGTRALVAAQQWDRARAHVAQHRGVGRRLLDGRQVEIVSQCLHGGAATARHVLAESTLSEVWESPVASCLDLLCRTAGGEPVQQATVKVTADYLGLEGAPELAVFRTRLGLTVLGLSSTGGAEVARRLVHDAMLSLDGYVARDILASAACSAEMTRQQRRRLVEAVASAGLDQDSVPPHLEEILLKAVEISAAAAARELAAR